MTVVLNPLPFDTSQFGSATITSFIRWRNDGAWLSVLRGTAAVFLKKTATDEWNTAKIDHALPTIARIGGDFRNTDYSVFGPNTTGAISYASYDAANDRYRWASGQTIATLSSSAAIDMDISPDGAHLAVKSSGELFVYNLAAGVPNPPQIFNISGLGAQGGLRYSPDGQYLAIQGNSGVRLLKRDADTYTDITGSGWPVASGSVIPEWKPDSQQLLCPTTTGYVRVFDRNADGTFTYQSSKDLYFGSSSRTFPRFIGAENKYLLLLPFSSSGAPKLYSVNGLNFTEVPTAMTFAGVTCCEVCPTDRALVAIGFAATAAAPNMGIYRVTGDATLDVDGAVVNKAMTGGGLVYHGNDTDAQEEIPIRPGVLTLRAPIASIEEQVADYTAIVGAVSAKKMIADGLLISGISIMSANLRAKRMTAEGQLTAAGTVSGDLVNKKMVADGLVQWTAYQINASFVGKSGKFEGQIETVLGLSADFAGKKGALQSTIANGSVFWGEFVGKKGSLGVELYNPFQLSGSFVGPKGELSASLEEYKGSVVAEFVGKKGTLNGEMYNPVVVIADLVGKKGSFAADLQNLQGISASFVGPKGYMEGRLDRGQRLDANFLGKRGTVGGEFSVNYPPNEAYIEGSIKKITSSMTARTTRKAVLTFMRIGNT